MTLMFAGLRIGEVLALRWRDIDLDKKTIRISYAITKIPKFDREGNVLSATTTISDTKTVASIREIPIPDILVTAIEEWRIERKHSQFK